MKISDRGLRLLKEFEGCKLKSYQCSAGVWTCGWGATGADIGPDTQWTQDEADKRLESDLERFEDGVMQLAEATLNQSQFDALVCFAYNCGLGNLKKSTLLKYVNKGLFAAAANEFVKWIFAGGVQVRGLRRRRLAEKALFEYQEIS